MVAEAARSRPELEEANEAGALFKIREDPAGDARRPIPPPILARRDSTDRERVEGRDEHRGAATSAAPRLPAPRGLAPRAMYRSPRMTGLWQISGRSGLTFDDLVRLDFTYLENWSIWLDITIIARTIPAVIGRPGRTSHGEARLASPGPMKTPRILAVASATSTSISATAARQPGGSSGRGCTRRA